MPFVERSDTGGWREKREIRLIQLPAPARATEFRFDQEFGYTTQPLTVDSDTHGIQLDAKISRAEALSRPLMQAKGRGNPAVLEALDYSRTDLASVPQILWGIIPSYGKYTLCALMHDHFCHHAGIYYQPALSQAARAYARMERRRADQLFRISLADVGDVRLARRWLMWAAVRVFGFLPVAVPTLLMALVIAAGSIILIIAPSFAYPLLESFWTRLTVGALTVILVIGLVQVSRESNRPYSSDGPPRFRRTAAASISGACAIFLMSSPLALPVVVVTGLTRLGIGAADLLGELVCFAFRLGRRRTRLAFSRL